MAICSLHLVCLQERQKKIVSWLFSKSCNDFRGTLEYVVIESTKKGGNKNNKKSLKETKARKTS
jgi:hypothetical protein